MKLDIVFQPRMIVSQDWATVLFLMALVLVVVAKSTASVRFSEFTKLIFTDKYLKIYKDPSNLMSWFTIVLFLFQLISFSFFILVCLDYFEIGSKYNFILFIQLITFLVFFILSKYLIEKIIATSFNIEDFAEQFNLLKVSYRTYLGLILMPATVILYYNDEISGIIIYLILAIILLYNAITYFISIRQYQSLIINQLFYFILYLCALEIVPYYFMYYWFTKT
jgi:hypothetical protein